MSSVLAALLAGTGAAYAGCDAPTSNDDVSAALEKALIAYEAVEIPAFKQAASELDAIAECLGETITPPTAAEFHRVNGLAAFLERETELCEKEFASARVLQPDYIFPENMVPKGNPVLDHYGAVDIGGPKAALPYPKEGSVRIDGSTRLERDPRLPVIFQQIDARGAVIQTVILAPGTPHPTYEEGKAPRQDARDFKTLKRILVVAGGGTLIAAGSVYGAALASKSEFKNSYTEWDRTRIDSHIDNNHKQVIWSAGLGAAGAGLTTTSFLLSGKF